MTSKCPSRPKCSRIRRAVGSAFEVATASRMSAARRSASSCLDAVEQPVVRPAARGVVGAVGGDGGVGVLAQPHRLQRLVHRRPDDPAGQVAVGNRGADTVRAHGGSWTRCPAPNRSACRRGRRSPIAGEPPWWRCPAFLSRLHCPRSAGAAAGRRCSPESRRTTVVMWQFSARCPAGGGVAVSVKLADVIDVLDDAYPPGLAQDWDSVGLVCGDPDEAVESVTIAVDATAAVVAEVPAARAAAGPPSAAAARCRLGRRRHPQRRAGASPDPHRTVAVHRPHQRRLGLAGCVRRAGRRARAHRAGGAGAGGSRARPGQVGGLRARRGRRGGARGDVRRRRGQHRRLLALQLERPRDRSVPSARRRRPGDRQRRLRGTTWPRTGWRSSRRPGCVVGCWPRCARRTPTRSRPSTSSRWPLRRATSAWAASVRWPRPEPLSAFVARVCSALPSTSWGVRAAGEPEAMVSRVAVCGGAGDSLLGAVAARRRPGLRHRRPAPPSRRRTPTGLRGGTGRRRPLGQRVPLVRSGGRAAAQPLR